MISALVPAIPLNEAASVFTKSRVKVVGGRFEVLVEKMAESKDVDLVCAGAEYLIDITCYKNLTRIDSRRSLGMRMSCLTVQKGNPKKINSLESLLAPGMRIGISTEGCTLGIWEEIVNRSDIPLDTMKTKIKHYLMGCGSLIGALRRSDVDAVFGWTAFEKTASNACESVVLSNELTIVRSTGIALTTFTQDEELCNEFIEFLLSKEGDEIYKKYGWERPW
ncbi:MAG: substrate-binding domain-containing protein [Candidatus Thermoplasmatota archaeon]|nr:substrate-binding domain-containing protein [Candidatus Thermoplasmatota archaeon]